MRNGVPERADHVRVAVVGDDGAEQESKRAIAGPTTLGGDVEAAEANFYMCHAR